MLRDLNTIYLGGMRRLGLWSTGVRGDSIPATSGDMPAWMYSSLDLPADAANEYAYWIKSHNFPFGLPLDDYSVGTILGLPAGTYTALVDLEENGVNLGPFLATVTVLAGQLLPVVITQPVTQMVGPPLGAIFSYEFSGATSVQAQRRANPGEPWVNLSGATLTGFITDPITDADHGAQYRFGGTGPGGGPVYTDVAEISVETMRPSLVSPILFDDMLHRLAPYLKSCPPQTMVFHLRAAAIDFFQRTLVWRFDLTPVPSIVGQRTYTMPLPKQTAAARALAYTLGGVDTAVVDAESGQLLSDEGSSLGLAWTADRSAVTVHPIPAAAQLLGLRVALKPSQDGLALPKAMHEHYIEDITHGALARLLSMPGKDWSDINAAVQHKQEYELAVLRITATRAKGFRGNARDSRRGPVWF